MKQRVSRFEKRSVMLFAALTLSGAGALHAQSAPGSAAAYGAGAGARSTQQSSPAASPGVSTTGRSAAPAASAKAHKGGKLQSAE